MQAKDLISDIIPAISVQKTGLDALNWMEVFRIAHLPVVNKENEFIGLLSDTEVYDYDLSDKKIGEHNLVLHRPFVFENVHVYEVISLVSEQRLTIVPVLDKNKFYTGVISLHDLVRHFGRFTASNNPGVVFVLQMNQHDYSLSKISQIVESNGAKILSVYLTGSADTTMIELTVKINVIDFSPIRQTLERYDYTIKEAYTDNDKMQDLLEERYDEFIHFLNI